MKTQDQCYECDAACRRAEQSPGGDRYDKHKEEVEKLPLAYPAARCDVYARRGQQFVARRQIQNCLYRVKARIPGSYRQLATRSRRSVSLDVEIGVA